MNNRHLQKGLSIWAFLFTAVVIGFFIFLFMKIFPPYYDNVRIMRGLTTMVEENDVAKLNKSSVIRRLNRILLIDYVDEVVDMNKALRLHRRDNGTDISITYEEVVPIAYNLSVLVEFDGVVFAPFKR
jgi:hypothetical protein